MRERSARYHAAVNETLPPEERLTPAQVRERALVERDSALDAIDYALQLHLSLGDYREVEHFARIAKELDEGPARPAAPPCDWQAIFTSLGLLAIKVAPPSAFHSLAKMAGGYEPLTGALLAQLSAEVIAALVALSDDEMEAKIREVVPNLPAEAAEEIIQAIRRAAATELPGGNSAPTGTK